MSSLYQLIINSVAVIITAFLLPGIQLSGLLSAFLTALVLGLVNTFLKPILIAFTLPINFLSLGLFTLIINAVIIMIVGAIVPGFKVKSFWWALLFSLVLSLVNYGLQKIL